VFAPCFIFAHVVDAAVGWIILSEPVPTMEEVVASPLVLEIEYICPSVLKERERKRGDEHMAGGHSWDTVHKKGCSFRECKGYRGETQMESRTQCQPYERYNGLRCAGT